jgi:hypothetical protein
MSIKLADTLAPMADFPAAMAEHIEFDDGENLQQKLDDGSLGGGGGSNISTVIEHYRFQPASRNLIARIKIPNDGSLPTNHIISFMCLDRKEKIAQTFSKPSNVYRFDLYMGRPHISNSYTNEFKLENNRLTLYEYPTIEHEKTIKDIAKNIRLYYDHENLAIYIYLLDSIGDFASLGGQLGFVRLEYHGNGTITDSFLQGNSTEWGQEEWSAVCTMDDLEAPTIIEMGRASTSGKDFYRVVAQDKAGYFKFKPSSDGGNEQPLRATATDNYGGMIEISGNAPSQTQYKPFKCVRLSNGTYASYDAANTTNNKMKKLYLYDGYMYLQVETYTTVTFTGLIEEPTFVETLADTSTEIPIISLVNPSIKAAAGSNINTVGTPSVTASESNGTTTFTFNNLKGATGGKGDTGTRGSQWFRGTGITGTSTTATVFSGSGVSSALVNDMYLNTSTSYVYQCTVAGNASAAKWIYIGTLKGAKGDPGTNGTTPTIKAVAGSNINTVGTPSVTASTSGTTTTFTFNNLKGAAGTNGTTPTIKAAAGSNINTVGTPSVTASTSGTTTTFTFNNLKGATGAKGDDGYTKFPSTPGVLSSQGTVCSLSSKQIAVLFCIGSGGGSLSASSYPSGLTFNGSAWSSGTKSISVGTVYTINNNTSSSVDIKAVNNGGAGFLVFGPM